MTSYLALILGIGLTLFGFISVFKRASKLNKFKLIDYFILSVSIFNGVGFAFVIWFTAKGRNNSFTNQYINLFDSEKVLIYISLNFILIISVLFGNLMYKEKVNKNIEKIDDKYLIRQYSKIGWIMLILSIVCYGIYSKAYGGYIGLLNYSNAIRSGIFHINNPFSFLQKFGVCSLFASFIFLGIMITYRNYLKKNIYLGSVISVLFSIYFLYSLDGRVSLTAYLLTLLLGVALFKSEDIIKVFRKLFVISILGLYGVIQIGEILGRNSGSLGIVEFFTKELSFPFASYVANQGNGIYRFFYDLIVMPMFILPQKVWGNILGIKTISNYNTVLFSGFEKGTNGVTGSVPIDIITFSNLQLGVIGVVIIGIVIGIIFNLIENKILKIKIRGIHTFIYSNLIFNLGILPVLYADPQSIIARNFGLIVGAMISYIVFKVKLK